jgi:uncharacterized RDD family membrane protein YckC
LTGGVLWLGWTALYFVAFWVLTGQTPGARLLGVRVVSVRDGRLGVGRGVLRFVVMVLALVPLGAGFVTVLFDDRRRGPHDMAAGTVVGWAPTAPATAPGETAPDATAPDATAPGATAPGATAPSAAPDPGVSGSIESR